MKARFLLNLSMTLLAIALSSRAMTQTLTCGQQAATEALKTRNPAFGAKAAKIDQDWRNHLKTKQPAGPDPLGSPVTTLPVVVHIIHDNGPENISDAQVQTALQHLNEAYTNIGYYNPADGVDTRIQFCLAQRDPANQPTNGITHDVSPYTIMGGTDPSQDDLNVKNVNRWDPFHYINIWVVRSIPGPVAGFAYRPFAHGSDYDGIVVEAQFFGVSEAFDVVVIHEMGHYLGLYHTFEGGCTNNDCSMDGDRVCDTPPDQSTANIACSQTMNSCSTDALSGFSTDVNDLTKDYMDYGNVACMSIFTQGQSDLMNWSIQNIRMSLLTARSCMAPCPFPVSAAFDVGPGPLTPGSTISFTNQSVNAAAYTWSVNGTQQSNAADFSYTFPSAGFYTIRLLAASGSPLCADAEKDTLLQVLCPATAAFTPADTAVLIGATAHFVYTGSNATSWQWWLDGTGAGTGPTLDASFPAAGGHGIRLVATDGHCTTEASGHLQVVDPADSCSIHTFQLSMQGTIAQVAWEAAVDAQGNYLVSGLTASYGSGIQNGFVIKLDPAGRPLWSEAFGNTRVSHFNGGRVLADGGSIHSGSVQNGTSFNVTLTRLDVQGALLWAKTYTDPVTSIALYPRVFPLSAGGYAVGTAANTITLPLRVFRTDAAGNLLWAKSFLNNMNMSAADTWVLEDNGQLIVSVEGNRLGNLTSRGILLALDETSGNLLWENYYDAPGTSLITGKIYPYHGNYLLSVVYNGQAGTLMVDKQGNPLSAFVAQDPASGSLVGEFDLAVAADQSLTLTSTEISTASIGDVALINMTADGRFIMAKKYPQPYTQNLYSLRPTPDKGYFAVGNIVVSPGHNGLYFLKTDSALRLFQGASGGAGCPVIPFTPVIDPISVTATPFTAASSNSSITVADYQPQITPFQPPLTNSCEDPAACSLLSIIGRDTACSSRDSLVLTARRNPGCHAKLTWTTDDTIATMTQPTDSTISLHFAQTGKILLRANMVSGCKVFTDSASLDIPAAPGTVDLGPDIALCTQSTVRLNAGSGFRSYLWQDGSEDSSFTAWLPGTYWVTATDWCNIPHRDTLTITNTNPPAFDLGPNTAICQGDSIKLSAPAGFDSYHWSPAWRLSDSTAESVYASPLTDTVYTCTAIKGPGCAVTDSIRVKVNTCRKGIFFPGAFTPNKDGANDVYRPVIFGAMPLEYYLAIYNREGQLVFDTHDPSKGWDGRVRGIPSVTNPFLWYARYRFPNEPEQLEKGVLVLVR